jgi:hypothetical protein
MNAIIVEVGPWVRVGALQAARRKEFLSNFPALEGSGMGVVAAVWVGIYANSPTFGTSSTRSPRSSTWKAGAKRRSQTISSCR